MPTLGFNFAKGYTEHQCEVCGNIVPWIEANMFGECKECAAEANSESKHAMNKRKNKGAIEMNNKLTVWYKAGKQEEVKFEVKKNIQQNYGFSDEEFVSIGGGFKFLFDDETKGEIAISFIEEADALRVTVEGTWSWEVIEIFDICLPQSAEHDPA